MIQLWGCKRRSWQPFSAFAEASLQLSHILLFLFLPFFIRNALHWLDFYILGYSAILLYTQHFNRKAWPNKSSSWHASHKQKKNQKTKPKQTNMKIMENLVKWISVGLLTLDRHQDAAVPPQKFQATADSYQSMPLWAQGNKKKKKNIKIFEIAHEKTMAHKFKGMRHGFTNKFDPFPFSLATLRWERRGSEEIAAPTASKDKHVGLVPTPTLLTDSWLRIFEAYSNREKNQKALITAAREETGRYIRS